MRANRRVILAIASIVIASGCAGAPAPSAPPGAGAELTFHDSVVQARDEAAAGGADEAQLAILDAALANDSIPFEDAQQALNDFGNCLEGAGLALVNVQVIDDAGFKRLDYSIRAGEDTTVMDACNAKTFQWVDMLYQTQPAATQAQDAKFESALPALIACLQAGGVAVDSGSPADEVKTAMSAFMRDHTPKLGDPGVKPNPDGGWSSDQDPPELAVVPDCLQSVGISGY